MDIPEAPFIEGINHNTMLEEDLETRTQDDKRIKHINLHNITFADVILKGALTDRRKDDNDGLCEGVIDRRTRQVMGYLI